MKIHVWSWPRQPWRQAPAPLFLLILQLAFFLGGADQGVAQAQLAFPRGSEIQVTMGNGGFIFSPRVAMFGDGGFAVVWGAARDFSSERLLHVRFFAADGSPATGELLLDTGAGPRADVQTPDALVADPAGNLLLVYEHVDPATLATAVYALRLDRNGAPLGRPVRVNRASAQGRFGAVAAVVPPALGGGFAVAWTGVVPDPNPLSNPIATDVFLRRLDAGGRLLGPQRDIYAGGAITQPAVTAIGAAPDGSLTLSYVEGADIPFAACQRVAPDGTAANPVEVTGDLGPPGNQDVPSLSMAANGSFAIAWQNGPTAPGTHQSVAARLFAPDGSPVTGELAVSRPRLADQVLAVDGPTAAPLDGGGFVAVWGDRSGGAGGPSLRMRALAADGQSLTRPLRLDQSTGGAIFSPIVAGNPAGNLVAVWIASPNGFAPPENLRARLIDARPPPP
jgi:hypothetical protein